MTARQQMHESRAFARLSTHDCGCDRSSAVYGTPVVDRQRQQLPALHELMDRARTGPWLQAFRGVGLSIEDAGSRDPVQGAALTHP
jgi:hypothetical protein